MLVRTFAGALLALSVAVGAAAAQERVFNALTADQIEQVLKGLNLEFKKAVLRGDGQFFYDFNLAKRFSARLYFFNGKEMMLDVLFSDQSLETLNRWNATRAKFSRATSRKEAKGNSTALEANLNFSGGVTDNTVRRFIRDFETEVVEFDRFLTGKEIQPVVEGGDKVISLTTPKLEEIIDKIKLSPKKIAPKSDVFYYDYDSAKNYKIRLTYSARDQEIKVDAVFKKIPLETINRYNFTRKFIRAVLYLQGNAEYAALEANLDCSVGISENMVRHFLVTFEEEVQNFIEFIGKN
jgi:hypothetical protein